MQKNWVYRIKLLGITEIINQNIFERVHPCLIDVNCLYWKYKWRI